MILSFQGQVLPVEEATIPITSETVLFGRGIFETFLVEHHQVFQLTAHFDRFLRGLQQAHLQLNVTERQLRVWLSDLASLSAQPCQRIKLLGTQEGVWLFSTSWNTPPLEPRSLSTVPLHRGLADLKSTSYLECLLAQEQAEQAGADEALLCNHHGAIYETSRSNFYWLLRGRLCSKRRGVLPGVTRSYLSENLPGGLRWGNLNLKELDQIEGAFLSNGVRGLVPVVRINQRELEITEQGRSWCDWLEEEKRNKAESL